MALQLMVCSLVSTETATMAIALPASRFIAHKNFYLTFRAISTVGPRVFLGGRCGVFALALRYCRIGDSVVGEEGVIPGRVGREVVDGARVLFLLY